MIIKKIIYISKAKPFFTFSKFPFVNSKSTSSKCKLAMQIASHFSAGNSQQKTLLLHNLICMCEWFAKKADLQSVAEATEIKFNRPTFWWWWRSVRYKCQSRRLFGLCHDKTCACCDQPKTITPTSTTYPEQTCSSQRKGDWEGEANLHSYVPIYRVAQKFCTKKSKCKNLCEILINFDKCLHLLQGNFTGFSKRVRS